MTAAPAAEKALCPKLKVESEIGLEALDGGCFCLWQAEDSSIGILSSSTALVVAAPIHEGKPCLDAPDDADEAEPTTIYVVNEISLPNQPTKSMGTIIWNFPDARDSFVHLPSTANFNFSWKRRQKIRDSWRGNKGAKQQEALGIKHLSNFR